MTTTPTLDELRFTDAEMQIVYRLCLLNNDETLLQVFMGISKTAPNASDDNKFIIENLQNVQRKFAQIFRSSDQPPSVTYESFEKNFFAIRELIYKLAEKINERSKLLINDDKLKKLRDMADRYQPTLLAQLDEKCQAMTFASDSDDQSKSS